MSTKRTSDLEFVEISFKYCNRSDRPSNKYFVWFHENQINNIGFFFYLL